MIAECPICGQPVDWETSEHGLFCSEECAEQFRQRFNVLAESLDTELPASEN